MTAMLSSNTIRKIKSRTPIQNDLVTRLVLLYRPQIVDFLVRKQGLQWADAEDLSGLVLEKVVEKRSQFKGAKQLEFWGWIRTIARRLALDSFKKNKNWAASQKLSDVDSEELVSDDDPIESDISPTEFLCNIMHIHLKHRKSAVAKELHDEIQWVCSDWNEDQCSDLLRTLFEQMEEWLVQNIAIVFSINSHSHSDSIKQAVESEKVNRDAASWQAFLLIHVMNLKSPLSANLVNKTAATVRKSAERIYQAIAQKLDQNELQDPENNE